MSGAYYEVKFFDKKDKIIETAMYNSTVTTDESIRKNEYDEVINNVENRIQESKKMRNKCVSVRIIRITHAAIIEKRVVIVAGNKVNLCNPEI
jgi:hypothetical protein